MIVLALDPATVTGWAVLDLQGRPSIVRCGVLTTKGMTPGQRYSELVAMLTRIHEWCDPAVLAYELPTPRGMRSAALQYGLIGCIELHAHRRERATWTAYPSTIKKAVAGSGRADKGAMAAAVRRSIAGVPKGAGHDVIDAIAVGLAYAESLEGA